MEKQHGIVLKSFLGYSQKCVIFDREYGKIDTTAVRDIEKLSPGFLIAYQKKLRGRMYYLDCIELIETPLWLAREHIYFLHHILEVCYYCMPYECSNANAFSLLEILLHKADQVKYSWFKKIFLLRLFNSLGMYPEDESVHTERIEQLLAQSFFDEREILDSHTDQVINRWLRSCLAMHPYKDLFKTLAIGSDHVLYE